MASSNWNPFKSKGPAPEPGSFSTLEVASVQQQPTQEYSTLEVAPSPVRFYSGIEVVPVPENDFSQAQYETGLEVAGQQAPAKLNPAHHIVSNPNRRIECGIWNDMRFFAGSNGMEMTMSRGSTLVSDTNWQVNGNCKGNGWGILRIKGKTGSLNRKREFMDSKGALLFTMHKQNMSSRVAESADGKALFSIKRTVGLKVQFTIEFTNIWDEQKVTWEVNGSSVRRGIDVSCKGYCIGSVHRPYSSLKEMFTDKCTYVVSVGPSLDYTIMAAITVVYDDMRIHEGATW